MTNRSNKAVVIVTGASKGLGLAITRLLLGAFFTHVVTISRTTSNELKELQGIYSEDLVVVQGDMTALETSTEAVAKALERWNRLDAVILNAGINEPFGRIAEADVEDWKRLFDINLFSNLHTLKLAIPHLRESKGRVVFTSSGSSQAGVSGIGAYGTSKAAINLLCKTLGNEEHDIVSVSVRPGMLDTKMQTAVREAGILDAEEQARHQVAYEQGLLVKTEDAGYVIAALALSAPKEFSGKYVVWNSEECRPFMAKK